MSGNLKNRVQRLLDFARNDNKQKRTRGDAYRLSPHNRMKIGCVIRAADQRSRGDIEKTFSTCDVAVIIELLWRDVFDNGQMVRTWPQVLTNCQHFAADL